ncbi:hypothetical protein Tco_1338629 [Tanacetum coccineum]
MRETFVEFAITSVDVVRPVNTRHRWDETCLLDIIVIKSTDVVAPISPAPPTDSEYLRSGMRYMIHNEELKSMFEKQAGVEWFDLIQTFHACKQDEGKPVGPYVIR